ncbi:MAG: sugar phosphate isomerase/epimerase [Hyphomicrobiaceae bacterium]
MSQRLEIFQSLWAMELRRPDGVERTHEEAFEMVAAAGYHGMAIDMGVADDDKMRRTQPLFRRYDLGCLINAFPRTIEDLRPVLRMARDFDARFVNVIGQVMPITVAEMVPVVRAWIAMADAEQVPILFETHRNCITNDLFTTLQLIDAIPEMSLCADLSHFLVDREFWYPISEENHGLIRRVLDRSDAFQGRVASREQIQVQISFPQHQKWFDLFAGWWEKGIRGWRARSTPDAVLNFCCELGPMEYAMTGPDGYELSDRWAEALMIRRRVEAIWAGLEASPLLPD